VGARQLTSPAPIRAAFSQALSEAWSGGAGALLPGAFFAGAAMLVPLTVGPDMQILARIGPGILWAALALASLVTMERVFQSDLEDGALDLWLTSGAPISAIAAAKTLAHWLASGLPLVFLTPLLGATLNMEPARLIPAAMVYGIGGIAFYFWGAFGAALASTVRRGGLLIALIALPFYVPTAIFGAMTLASPETAPPELLFTIAATLFALAVAPFGMAAALRLAAD